MLVERSQHASRIVDQIEQAAGPSRPLLWILFLRERRGRRELVLEVDRQSARQGRTELSAQDGSRRRRPHEAGQLAGRRDGGAAHALESRNGIAHPAAIPGVGERNSDPLNAGDRVPPQREREPSRILVVVQVAGDVDALRADLVEHDVADEVTGVDEPPFPHHDGWVADQRHRGNNRGGPGREGDAPGQTVKGM
ncbi:hypothetical protein OG806_08045 [Streptomyces sp. NBC_00882]|uniref:hypothetical protein n=1 Tax=Streptomyces TaxID=1883 RepID=UPI00386987C0|nr:hypothetical protein OG806_08045 [Streptomyces sp. NBC_00882]WSZ56259.1 hypothetical protein OH824_06790 [Streptomyces canus]